MGENTISAKVIGFSEVSSPITKAKASGKLAALRSFFKGSSSSPSITPFVRSDKRQGRHELSRGEGLPALALSQIGRNAAQEVNGAASFPVVLVSGEFKADPQTQTPSPSSPVLSDDAKVDGALAQSEQLRDRLGALKDERTAAYAAPAKSRMPALPHTKRAPRGDQANRIEAHLTKRGALRADIEALRAKAFAPLPDPCSSGLRAKTATLQREVVKLIVKLEISDFGSAAEADFTPRKQFDLAKRTRTGPSSAEIAPPGLGSGARKAAVTEAHARAVACLKAGSRTPEDVGRIKTALETEIAFLRLGNDEPGAPKSDTLKTLEKLHADLGGTGPVPATSGKISDGQPLPASLNRDVADGVAAYTALVTDCKTYVADCNAALRSPASTGAQTDEQREQQAAKGDRLAKQLKDCISWSRSDGGARNAKLPIGADHKAAEQKANDYTGFLQDLQAAVSLRPKYERAIDAMCKMEKDVPIGKLARDIMNSTTVQTFGGYLTDTHKAEQLGTVFEIFDQISKKSVVDGIKTDDPKVSAFLSQQRTKRYVAAAEGKVPQPAARGAQAARNREAYSKVLATVAQLRGGDAALALEASIWAKPKVSNDTLRYKPNAASLTGQGSVHPTIGLKEQIGPRTITNYELKKEKVTHNLRMDAMVGTIDPNSVYTVVDTSRVLKASLQKDKQIALLQVVATLLQRRVAEDEKVLFAFGSGNVEAEIKTYDENDDAETSAYVRKAMDHCGLSKDDVRALGYDDADIGIGNTGGRKLEDKLKLLYGVGFHSLQEIKETTDLIDRVVGDVIANRSNQEDFEGGVNAEAGRLSGAMSAKAEAASLSGQDRVAGQRAMVASAISHIDRLANSPDFQSKGTVYDAERTAFLGALSDRAAIDVKVDGHRTAMGRASVTEFEAGLPATSANAKRLLHVLDLLSVTPANEGEIKAELSKLKGFDTETMRSSNVAKLKDAVTSGGLTLEKVKSWTETDKEALRAKADMVVYMRDQHQGEVDRANSRIVNTANELQTIRTQREAIAAADPEALATIRQAMRAATLETLSGKGAEGGVFYPVLFRNDIMTKLKADFGFTPDTIAAFAPEFDDVLDGVLDGEEIANWAADLRDVDDQTKLVKPPAPSPAPPPAPATFWGKVKDKLPDKQTLKDKVPEFRRDVLNERALDTELRNKLQAMFDSLQDGDVVELSTGRKLGVTVGMKDPSGIASLNFSAAGERMRGFSVERTGDIITLSVRTGGAVEVGTSVSAEASNSFGVKGTLGVELGVGGRIGSGKGVSLAFRADAAGQADLNELIRTLAAGERPKPTLLERALPSSFSVLRTVDAMVAVRLEAEAKLEVGGLIDGGKPAYMPSVDSTSSTLVPSLTGGVGASAGLYGSMKKNITTARHDGGFVKSEKRVLQVRAEGALGINTGISVGIGDAALASTQLGRAQMGDVSKDRELAAASVSASMSGEATVTSAEEYTRSATVPGLDRLARSERILTRDFVVGLRHKRFGITNDKLDRLLDGNKGAQASFKALEEQVRGDDRIAITYKLGDEAIETYNELMESWIQTGNKDLKAKAQDILDDLDRYEPTSINVIRVKGRDDEHVFLELPIQFSVTAESRSEKVMVGQTFRPEDFGVQIHP